MGDAAHLFGRSAIASGPVEEPRNRVQHNPGGDPGGNDGVGLNHNRIWEAAAGDEGGVAAVERELQPDLRSDTQRRGSKASIDTPSSTKCLWEPLPACK
ncbi:hypothetical protein MUK42_25753 [Musa troglodytarum]|uniref:Uncharacterized protein n=1 Tax=Musa troglodytarum TaxID=320322 RepID=A0A9E7HZG8_9LILI|nr:hypothetical protein MUK42_25753 [Musa troglodytarum]